MMGCFLGNKKKEYTVLTKDKFDAMLNSSYASIQAKANFLLKTPNLRQAGSVIEDFVKNLFTQLFNSRFRITSGYIVNSEKGSDNFIISPEIDLIILDTFVPNILFPQNEFIGRTEYVPIEAVVGIFEIKKTLDKESVKKAFKHFKNIEESVGICKNNCEHYRLGGKPTDVINSVVEFNTRYRDPLIIEPRKIRTGVFSNPITGIIGLEHKGRNVAYNYNSQNFVDLIFSFDGFLQAVVEKTKGYFNNYPIVNPNEYEYKYVEKSQQNIKIALGLLTDYLYNTSGKCFNPSKYYVNTNMISAPTIKNTESCV